MRLGGADGCSIILAQTLAHFPFQDDKNCVIKICYLRLAAEVAIEHLLKTEHCVFIWHKKSLFEIIAIWVNDLFILASDSNGIAQVKSDILKEFHSVLGNLDKIHSEKLKLYSSKT